MRPFPFLATTIAFALVAPAFAQQKLELKKGDHIAIVGSGLADRQQHHGWLESLIHKAYPDLGLTVRNLGFAADEVNVHPRSDEVPTTEYFLSMKPGTLATKAGNTDVVYHAGADFHANVILAYWGFNESFKGEAGLADFKKALDEYLKKLAGADYGKGKPRVVLLSPIAHENVKDPTDYPDGAANNKNLVLYTAAMGEVAKTTGVQFVDLFTASQAAYAQAAHPLTINGIHLSEEGDKVLAPVQFKSIFGKDAPTTTDPAVEKIRQAVLEKNVQWHHRYRTVDQFNIFGQRSRIKYKEKDAPGEGVDNATILGQELAQRDVKTANRDKAVWAAAQGKAYIVKDDNLPPVQPTPPNRKEPVPYLGGEEALKTLTVPPGAKIEFIASEVEFPELINPVQMNFDTRGRLWVSAWPTYPETTPTTTNYDKLIVFDIDPKNGKFTKCTTFADGLNCPTGFQLYKDGVLVMQSPDMWFMRDTDGDGKADWKERIVHGLDAADSHHETNSICYEPGGAVYFSDGVFHRTNVETLNGPIRNVNGAIYRFEPRTSRFDRYVPYGFANPHGRVFDYWGNDIITDATGNASYFAPAFSGHLDSGAHPGMKQFWNRPSRPCPGTAILSSRHFPDDWQGEFLNTNVISFQGIYRAKVTEDGSGLKGETVPEHMLSADIAANPNFRPSGVAVAPDGSLYVMDWSQMLIGHLQHHLRDPNRDHQHGRIYRITFPGRPLLQPKKIAGEPIENLLELLKEQEDNVRQRAKIELDTHDTAKVIAAVQKWEKALDKKEATYEHNRLEALWVHQWHNVVNLDLLNAVLKSSEPRARAQAVRVLCYWRDRVPNAPALLKTAAEDESPRVRLEAVRAASFFSGKDVPAAFDVAYTSLKHDGDYYLDYCYGETLKQLRSIGGDAILPTDPAVLAKMVEKMSDSDLSRAPGSERVYMARIERKTTDAGARDKAINELAKLHKTDRVSEIISVLGKLDAKGAGAGAQEIAKMLGLTAPSDLVKARAGLTALAQTAKPGPVANAAWAALVIGDGKPDGVWANTPGRTHRQGLIGSIALIPDPALRAKFQPLLATALGDANFRADALKALPLMGAEHAKANFKTLVAALQSGDNRTTAARALMQLQRDSWDKSLAGPAAESVLTWAKTVPQNDRTKQDFIETVQTGSELASLLAPADATRIRKELRGLGVSVFVIKTVHEQMRYDTTRLVVEAGKPFEIIIENLDAMPHNLVIVDPGTRQSVAEAVQTRRPDQLDKQGRPYVPEKDKRVHEASKLVEPGQKDTIKWTAPNREGEYEYVCTFPGHWMIMWGRIVVTKDVDAYVAAHPDASLPAPGAPVPPHNHK
jgi:azurin/glucose/arabinose dehydrogenase